MRLTPIFVVLLAASTLFAQTPPEPATRPAPVRQHGGAGAEAMPAPPTDKPSNPEKVSVVHHTMTLNGQALAYTSTAGYLPLKGEDGKLRANMFYVAYTVDGAATQPVTQSAASQPAIVANARPITFVFNGGPGAAAVWLHIGALGPKKILLGEGGKPLPPPAKLVDNPNTWLGKTDMVFIDPVNTGYSRAATPEMAKEFFGVNEDVTAMGEFIRLYITNNDRWGSPRFLAGESYGTTRAAVLSEYLGDRQGIAVNGIVLISSVLNFSSLHPGEGNDMPYALYLPTYAALAVYHGKAKMPAVKPDHAPYPGSALDDYLKEVEVFALGDYTLALNKGATLSAKDRAAVVEKLVQYTGLSKDYIEKSNLRIDPTRFEKELLNDQGKILGRYDGRITGFTADEAGDRPDFDPSFSFYLPIYQAAFNMYVKEDLQYTNDLHYEVLSGRVQPWNMGSPGGGFLYVADNLRAAIQKNPSMKVFVAAGRYDLATPYFSADYWVSHMGLPEALRGNITQMYYPSGHMIYHDPGSMKKLHDEVMDWMK